MIVIAAVAFLAVVQQQLSGQLSGRFQDDENLLTVGLGDAADTHYYGLVGLSLTYALPIVGEHTAFAYFYDSRVGKECAFFDMEAQAGVTELFCFCCFFFCINRVRCVE